ncbi:MAG: GNAT family N-acetyltransferase [Bacillota bacterium]|nr:GNAT family N-acetyltransferase [Bacillota bacterium]
MRIETERLLLREMNEGDYLDLCKILQDKDVMYAYDGPFSDEGVQQWLDKQKERYRHNELGLLALVLKDINEMIGQCGLTWQEYKSEQVLEIGYLLRKDFWGNGYATEAAKASDY